MATNEYRHLMQELVRLLQPETYVEIGVAKGNTFNLITGAGIGIIKRAVAVDIKEPRHIKKREGMKIELYVGTSLGFSVLWHDPIDLLFIDANHRKENVLMDFNSLSHYVTDKGLILLHDTCPSTPKLTRPEYCYNAWEAARKIHKEYEDFEIVTLPGPKHGLSIIRRAERHLLWI